MKLLKEPNGELRCPFTLELWGYWFEFRGKIYYGTKENWDKL
jgi:hypothetical protein